MICISKTVTSSLNFSLPNFLFQKEITNPHNSLSKEKWIALWKKRKAKLILQNWFCWILKELLPYGTSWHKQTLWEQPNNGIKLNGRTPANVSGTGRKVEAICNNQLGKKKSSGEAKRGSWKLFTQISESRQIYWVSSFFSPLVPWDWSYKQDTGDHSIVFLFFPFLVI